MATDDRVPPDMPRHLCHARGCTKPVPEKMFMCRPHWFRLPKSMQRAVWDAYVPGQEVTKTPTEEYLVVTQQAIDYIAAREGGVV